MKISNLLALLLFATSAFADGGDDDMIQIIDQNPDQINGTVVELLIEPKDLPQVVQDKLAAGETITLVFDKKDKAKHIVGVSLGIGAAMGGQIGVTYSPPVAVNGKNIFEVSGMIGSAIVLTSYELGVNIRVPYVNVIYGHVGYQFVQTSRMFERNAAKYVNAAIKEQVDSIEDDQAREYVQKMQLGFTSDDFHFGMGGASFGVGLHLGPMRLEAGVNTMNVRGTANKLYDHLTGKITSQIESQSPPPPSEPQYPWEIPQYQQDMAAYNAAKAEYESQKNQAITEGRDGMNSAIDGFLKKSPGGLLPYVKLSFVIPILRK